MASWIDWPKGAVGGKHFLCVNGRSCRCTVAACGRVMAVIPFPTLTLLSLSQLIRRESRFSKQTSHLAATRYTYNKTFSNIII